MTVVSNNVLTVTQIFIRGFILSREVENSEIYCLTFIYAQEPLIHLFLFQVATQKVVHGDLNFALTKGIGCVRAGLIWLYNLVLLLTLVLVCKSLDRMLEFVIFIKLFPYPITYLLQET